METKSFVADENIRKRGIMIKLTNYFNYSFIIKIQTHEVISRIWNNRHIHPHRSHLINFHNLVYQFPSHILYLLMRLSSFILYCFFL